jgi:predicted HicB family RNase H-like nuclease
VAATTLIFNEKLPRELHKALNADAKQSLLTLNDTANRNLCDYYGLEWSAGKGRYRPGAEQFKLRAGKDLHSSLRIDAATRNATIRGLVLMLLSKHYGLEPISPARRTRRKVAA